jgi:leucyl aminopeptidase (aminopeptidase T)
VIEVDRFYEGARNAIKTCMAVQPGEHVLIVTDKAQYEVGDALRREAEKITPNNVKMFILEDFGQRPLTFLPKEIENAIPWANVTLYAAESGKGEIELRTQFIKLALKYARHGHLPGVTRKIMEEGMCVDYRRVSELTQKLYDIAHTAKTARVTSPLGTNLEVEFNPNWRWVRDRGLIHKRGEIGNLPAGELFTAPQKVNGKMVIELLGDWLGRKYGVITGTPVTIYIKDSRADLNSVECVRRDLKEDLIGYLQTDENSNRASEFALPTNISLLNKPLIGNLLQDEKARFHLAFGDPYSKATGADWNSKTHIDGIVNESDIWIDDKEIMKRGSYLV